MDAAHDHRHRERGGLSANGDCIAGNPTISLPSAITLSGKIMTGGTFTGGTFNSGAFNNGTFTGGTFNVVTVNASAPTLSLKTTQTGTREWRWAGAFNDADSISLVDVTASNAQRIYINSSGYTGFNSTNPGTRFEFKDADNQTPFSIAGATNRIRFNPQATKVTVQATTAAQNAFSDLSFGPSDALYVDAAGNIRFGSGSLKSGNTGIGGVSGCLNSDGASPATITSGSCGTGLPGGGSLGQIVLNTGSGTGNWYTQPFTNIAALSGADCTGAVATAISTVIGSVKSIALPTNCLLKVTANDTIPAGVFFAIPCGARVQVDGAAVLTFNAETDDNTCQKFSASGALSGSGGGVVKGLRFNRPEWWGAFGDCNYGGSCTHDDSGPLQQTFNSAQDSNASSGGRAQVKFACGKGYGVSTGVVATASRNAPLLISGCAPLDGGNSEGGSALYGRSGFTGIVLTVTGNTTTNIEIRDLQISSINNFQADVCLQIGSAGNTLSNASGHSLAQNLRLTYCKHLLKFAGSVVSFQFDRIWMVMGNNGSTSGANASCIEAVPNAEVLSELTFNAIACDGAPNSDATAICLNFHSQGASGGISGTRINDVSCYQPTNGLVIKAEGASTIPDFWCYGGCQMDALRAGSVGYSLTTTGTAIIADVVLDKTYATNVGAPNAVIDIDGSAGGTIKNIGVYGAYMATGGTLRGIRVTDAAGVQVQGARIGGTYVNQGILLNNCTGCLATTTFSRARSRTSSCSAARPTTRRPATTPRAARWLQPR
jgi:hypothetical protein